MALKSKKGENPYKTNPPFIGQIRGIKMTENNRKGFPIEGVSNGVEMTYHNKETGKKYYQVLVIREGMKGFIKVAPADDSNLEKRFAFGTPVKFNTQPQFDNQFNIKKFKEIA